MWRRIWTGDRFKSDLLWEDDVVNADLDRVFGDDRDRFNLMFLLEEVV
ncbi:hypothetical protein ACQKLG_17555 [Pedobacter suwonensis]